MYHNFLIHSSADGYVGCFHVLAKQCCNEHWGTYVSFNSGFLGVYAQQWDCWVISSVQFSRSVTSDSLRLHGLQHTRLSCPSPTPRVYSNSCPLSRWCHPTISSSIIPFSSHLQSFPASGSFQMSQLFASGGQSIGVSASTSVLPMNNWLNHGVLSKWMSF